MQPVKPFVTKEVSSPAGARVPLRELDVAVAKEFRGQEKKFEWRRGRDSNSRRALTLAGFQDRCIKPLCHPSFKERKIIQAELFISSVIGLMRRRIFRFGHKRTKRKFAHVSGERQCADRCQRAAAAAA